MFRTRTWVLVALAVILGGGVLLVGRRQEAEAGFQGCKLDGAWIVRFGDGLFYETFVTDPLGARGIVSIDPIVSNVGNFGGETPAAGARGNIRRVSQDSWEFEIISHGRTLTTATEVGSITDIQVFRGVTQLTDCDTQAVILDVEIYLASADGDGDGFPDDGAEPIAVVEGVPGAARRISNL